MEDNNKRLDEHINDYLLELSSTKLGQTDYDPNADYSAEEPPVSLKKVGLLLLCMLAIILVATGTMLLFTHVNHYIAIGVLVVVAIVCAIVIKRKTLC